MAGKKQIAERHPILDRVLAINPSYVEESDWDEAPVDRQQFLDWWWAKYAENCERCVLSVGRNMVVKPDGRVGDGKRPLIMIVGEGPGVLEDNTGLPMVSPNVLRASRCGMCNNVYDCYDHKMLAKPDSRHPRNKEIICRPEITNKLQLRDKFYVQSAGSILDGLLVKKWKMNYPRQSWIELYNRLHPTSPWENQSPWFVTNTVLCRSFDKLTKKDCPPGTAPSSICRRWLAWQYAAVQPAITVCMGLPALNALAGGQEKASVPMGEIYESKKFGNIIYIPHPAHAMREKNTAMKALEFGKFGDVLRKALEFCGYPTT